MGFKPSKLNPLKLIKRSETVRCMIIGKQGRYFKMPTLVKEGDFVRDIAKDRVYGPTRLRPLFDQFGKPAYLMHEETGAPLEISTEKRSITVSALDGWTQTPLYNEEGQAVYFFDEDGNPAEFEMDVTVVKCLTDPEMMGTLTDKTLLTNALNRHPQMGFIIVCSLAALLGGLLIGVSF